MGQHSATLTLTATHTCHPERNELASEVEGSRFEDMPVEIPPLRSSLASVGMRRQGEAPSALLRTI